MGKAFLSVISELPAHALSFCPATLEVTAVPHQELRDRLKEGNLFLYESSVWKLEFGSDKWQKKHEKMLHRVEGLLGGSIPIWHEVNHQLQPGESLFVVLDMNVDNFNLSFRRIHVVKDERSSRL